MMDSLTGVALNQCRRLLLFLARLYGKIASSETGLYEILETSRDQFSRPDPDFWIAEAQRLGVSRLHIYYLDTKAREPSHLLPYSARLFLRYPATALTPMHLKEFSLGNLEDETSDLQSLWPSPSEASIKFIAKSQTQVDVLEFGMFGANSDIFQTLGAHRPFLLTVNCGVSRNYGMQHDLGFVMARLEECGYFPIRLMRRTSIASSMPDEFLKSYQIHGEVVFVPNFSALGREIVQTSPQRWYLSLLLYGYGDFADFYLQTLMTSAHQSPR